MAFAFGGRHFGYQLQLAQRAYELSVRLMSADACGIDRRVVTAFGPAYGFGHVDVPVTLGPGTVDEQFHLTHL